MGVDDHGGLRGGCLRPHWQTRLRRGVVQCRRRPRPGAFDAHPAQPRQAVGSPQAGAPLVAKAPLCAPVGTARVRGRAVHLVRRRHVAALHGQRRAVCGGLVLGTPPTLDPHSPLWLLIPTALCGSQSPQPSVAPDPHSPLAPATPCSRPCCPSPLLTNLLIAH